MGMWKFAGRSALGGASVGLGICLTVLGRILFTITRNHNWGPVRDFLGIGRKYNA